MRCISCLALFCVASFALAQAPFTIVRPADGSKVRERVRILIPRNSIPPGGYVGLFLNGHFTEALAAPTTSGKFYEYTLDTKAMEVPDGHTKIEMVLYMDYNDQPKVVDRSSVNVTVANKANIPVPARGLSLRYKYHLGGETIYKLFERFSQSQVTDVQSRRGMRGAETGADLQTYRYSYAVDNTFSDGDGLLRLQALPPSGKKQVFMQTLDNPNGRYYRESEFGEMYLRLTNTGRQVFGAVPPAFPMEGTDLGPAMPFTYVLKTLPTLPSHPIRPGDIWQTNFQLPAISDATLHQTNNLVSPVPARGEFEGVEWESGHPCAKIHQSSLPAIQIGGGRRVTLDETYWFALDKGAIVKIVRREMVDQPGGAAAPEAPKSSGGGAPVTPGGRPPIQTAGGRSGGGRFGGGSISDSPPVGLQQGYSQGGRQGGIPGMPSGVPGGIYQGQPPARQPAAPAPGARPAAAPGAVTRYTIEDTFILQG